MTVHVFGMDGAEPELVDRYIEEGVMPNLAEMREKGVYADLETVFPPITPAAWTSFMTGKNPGKHGIYDFSVRTEGNRFELVTSSDVRSETVYDLMERHGKTVGSLGIPLTYPPRKMPNGGYMVSGLPIDRIDRDKVHPGELWDDIEEWGGLSIHASTFTGDNEEEYIETHHEQIDQMENVFFNLLETHDLDLNLVLFPNTDTMGHWMWKYIDENHPDHEPGYEDCMKNVYSRLDEILGRLRERIDDEDHLIVMSDHGFGPVHKNIYLNNLFAEEGILRFKTKPSTIFRRVLLETGITPDRGYRLAARLGIEEYLVQSEQKEDGGLIGALAALPVLSENDIDWNRTTAFVRGNFGQIYLSPGLEGDEREEAIERVKNAVYSLEDPETGEQVVEDVRKKEEMYEGPMLDRAPDLVFFTKDLKYMSWRHFEFGSRKKIKPHPSRTGHHKMTGIFAIEGPGVGKGEEIGEKTILDVVPTVLALMDIPVPGDMDGEPIDEAFTKDLEYQTASEEISELDY